MPNGEEEAKWWLDLVLTDEGKRELSEENKKMLAFFLHECAEYLNYGDDRYLRDLISYIVEYRHGDSYEKLARFFCELSSELAPDVDLESVLKHYQMHCICAC